MAYLYKRKVCVIIASRANYGRIKSVLTAINEHPGLELMLVVGASALLYRFGGAVDVIEKDGFTVNAKIYSIVEGGTPSTMAKSAGFGLLELPTIFENLEPDIVLTVADRFETISTAIAATYMNIPLAHTQGGEVTGSIDESVRHAITKLAHIHFPATEKSRERLVKMGEREDMVFNVGCPSIDAIANIDLSLRNGYIKKRYGGVGGDIDFTKPYLLVLQHPVTTEYGSGLKQINETLLAIKELKISAIMLWPNVDAGTDDISKGIRVFRENNNISFVHFYRNFSVEDYAKVMNNCACIVGNSSSAIREGAFLGVPAVNIGTRQAGRERGKNIIDVDYQKDEIKSAIKKQISNGRYKSDYLYGDGRAGARIADILSRCEISIQKRLAY